MTIRLLKIFIMVYQLRSITKASQRLHMVQPSVSVAIKELEDYYGVKLFERVSRRMDPTVQADALYEYAMHLMEVYDEMENDLKHHAHTGRLRIGTTITLGQVFLPGLMTAFKHKYPDLSIQARIQNTQMIEEAILTNQIDLALVEGKLTNPSSIATYPFFEDELVAVCHPGHPLAKVSSCTLAQLANYAFLFRENGSSVREQVDHLLYSHDLHIEPILESVSTQALLQALYQNLGITILPEAFVRADIQAGRLCRIHLKGIHLKRQTQIIHHQNKYLSPLLQEVIAYCQEAAQKTRSS